MMAENNQENNNSDRYLDNSNRAIQLLMLVKYDKISTLIVIQVVRVLHHGRIKNVKHF
jgi:hypothetical protein